MKSNLEAEPTTPKTDTGVEKPKMGRLNVLIAELKAYEKSLNFNLAGYTQKLPDGKEHFCCMMCGHSPALLIERLKDLL
jgi:hypothetical protein